MKRKRRNRKELWLGKGYTQEQINNHLSFERRKSKESRERRKRNNVKNSKVIAQIKSDLLGQTFGNFKVLSISPTTDGKGFWFKMHRMFKDGSEGEFRYFFHFDGYSKKEFLENVY